MLIAFHETTENADWTIDRVAQARIILAGGVTAGEPRASYSALHEGLRFRSRALCAWLQNVPLVSAGTRCTHAQHSSLMRWLETPPP